jgi:Caspase domain
MTTARSTAGARNRKWLALLVVAVTLLAAAGARAEPNRFAVVIGNNRGDRDEVTLRYAESDAARVGTVLRTLGGFQPENVLSLVDLRAAEVRRALIAINARVRQLGGDSLMLVYYSGHADAGALHLDGSHLGVDELRDLVTGSSATARILVLDACRSGAVTRVKGGTPAAAFDIDLSFPIGAAGVAMLSSSAAGESSQESDALGASFFTHALVSALLGAGDTNRDGAVTLGEAFAYAKERTLATTSRTLVGPQHPTFRLDLGGREDLILTRPGAEHRDIGTLAFARPGVYSVHKGSVEGPVVAELAASDGGGRIALDAGRYFVTRRDVDYLEQGRFDVVAQRVTMVAPQAMARLDYARVVRKGGTARRASGSLFVDVGARGDIAGLGTAWRTAVGGRVDLRQISLELRLGFASSIRQNTRWDIDTHELSAALDAIRAFDLGPVTLDVGLEVGAAWLLQTFSDPPSTIMAATASRSGFAPFVGAVGQLEVPLPHRLYVRLELAGLVYFVHATDDGTQTHTTTAATYRTGLGVGMYF